MTPIRRVLTTGGAASFALAVALAAVLYARYPATLVRGVTWWRDREAGFVRHEVRTASGTVPYLEGGSGPVVVLLHGYQDRKDTWVEVARHLTDRFRVVIPDLHGFGDNHALTDGDYRPAAQAKRIHAFLAALEAGPVHLGGVSMGGEVAGAYAAAYPDGLRSLALFSAAGVRPDTISRLGRRILAGDDVFHVTGSATLDTLIALIGDSGLALPGVLKRAMIAEYRERNPQWDTVFRQLTEPAVRFLLDSLAPAIRTRTLVLWGAQDPLFPVSAGRRLAARLPEAEFVVLPDCGHLCPATRPQQVAARYRAFLLSGDSMRR